jgi:protein tyrosine phosphatase (PTP) superfamily phosphohydrolase (DUF442 family)
MRMSSAGAGLLVVLALLTGCGKSSPPVATEAQTASSTPVTAAGESPAAKAVIEKISASHLPNPVRLHEKVISGGLPEGDEAFAELKTLGIKTVVSVDGAKPDIATAEKYGMRYVHLPHGYDGVPEERGKELAKAVRDLPGPIYIHCHHGKHRSPAAAAVACIGAGFLQHNDAATVLKIAGTSESYRGLFESADSARKFESAVLDELKAEFPPVAKLPAMAEAMVQIEHLHDHLKAIEKAGWKTPADKPALVPDHEALLLREQFTELLRTKDVQSRPKKFQDLTREAEAASQALEDGLRAGLEPEAASKLLVAVSNNCKTCHQAFRDTPLREKSAR